MTRVRKLIFSSTLIVAGLVVTFILAPRVAQANEERVLYGFPLDGTDGANPNSGVIADKFGNLYGTTYTGGAYQSFGVLFKIRKGRETVLYSFGALRDAAHPGGQLVLDQAGNIYGAADGGAAFLGAVYKVTPRGVERLLHSFTGGSDGAGPVNGLVADAAGNLYGTTEKGGSDVCADGCGTIFKVTPDGQESVLYSFDGETGWDPKAGVTMDAQGNLYGTTYSGGTSNRGTVFKLTPDGQESVLHNFVADGHPFTGVVLDEAGNLYGTDSDFFGDVWKLTPDGIFTILHHFAGGSDGETPTEDLIIDGAGNLYGVLTTPGLGQVYKVAPDGTKTNLHSFAGGTDGSIPLGPLYMDAKGNLYGTTYYEGGGSGCVFKVINSG